MWTSLKRQVSACEKKEQTESCIITYEDYRMTPKEYVKYGMQGFCVVILFAYFFYHSYIAVFLLSPYVYYFLQKKRKELCLKRKQELCLQFRDMILSLSECLYAGYSVENAFREVYRDMHLLHGGDALICQEICHIIISLENNAVLEKLLSDLGNRSGVDDIRDFGEIFAIGKRSSGDLKEIIRSSAAVIGEKIEIKRDIRTLISAKVFEQKIMSVVPFAIILYISVTSKGFFAPLYHNAAGIVIMTGCLFVYVLSGYLSGKIIGIEV